jgi:hypothetical protein
MMEAKDFISGFVGFIVFLLGLIPILESFGVLQTGFSAFLGSGAFVAAIPFVLAILGFYLAIESVIELTNSNHIGYISFIIGGIIMLIGLLPALQAFGIGPGLFGFELPVTVYHIVFLIEGIFLMIAMFAMEL